MKIITTGAGNTIKIFSSAKEMPIDRYSEYLKYAVIKSGIGSNEGDIDARYAKVAAFITEDKKADALKELENARFALLSIRDGVNYDAYCFSCFIHSIDNVIYDDLTDEGFDVVIKKLGEIKVTQEEIESAVDDVKKKSVTK